MVLHLDMEVIQRSLSFANSALENKNDDLVRCGVHIDKLTQLHKSQKAMRLKSLSFIGNEYRGKV